MNLKVEINETELLNLIAAALSAKLQKQVAAGSIAFVVQHKTDMRGEEYGHTVTAQAILPI